ncbi:MAG: ATP-binding protein [Bacteroidales bacterium]
MRKIVFGLTFLLISITSYSINHVQADSLINTLNSTPDSLKAGILNEISWELRNSAPHKSIEYSLQAIDLATKFNDYENLVKAYSFVGVAYRILGNYSESTDYYYKGLELAQKYNVTEQEGYSYINIANLHIYQEYYNSALENLNKALAIAEKTNNKRMKAYVYLNLGRAQLLRKEYENALINLEKALALREEIKQISGLAVCYKYIGDIYFEKENFQNALVKYEASLKTVDESSDKDLTANIYIKIAEIYLQDKNYNLAEENAIQARSIAEVIGAKLVIRDALKILSEVYYQTNQYKKTAEFNKSIIKYNDTLFSQQLSEKIFNLEYRFEKEKKQAEIDLLNKDKQIQELLLNRSRTLSITLSIILSLVTLLFVFFLYTYRHRQKQNKLLFEQKEELKRLNLAKDKMFLIIGHDLRGPVGSLVSLIEVLLSEEEISSNKSLVNTFNVFMKSVQSINDLLENLLFWARGQRGEVAYVPEKLNLNLIVEKNLLVFKGIADSKDISLNTSILEEFNVYADKNMLTLIVRNLLSNAIKYTQKGGSVDIKIIQKENNLQFSIKDTGIGFNQDVAEKIFRTDTYYTTTGTNNEKGSGLGLILCKEFVTMMNGTIWAESNPGLGSTFYFTIPYKNPN